MISEEEMFRLDKANGAVFDQMWLDMMIRHHEGAINMSGARQCDRQHSEAPAVGRGIITAEQEEITCLRGITG